MATPLGAKQSVKHLKFVVYTRPLHPELFEIHHDHRINQPAFDAAIWVTGCTHVVRFSVADDTITEVMAQAEDELPERGLVVSFRCRGEKQHQFETEAHLRYMMNLQVETMSEKVYTATHQDLISAAETRGIYVPIPKWQTSALMPFCHVDYHTTAEGLHIFAYHAFPDELTIVKTQSIFEVHRPAPTA